MMPSMTPEAHAHCHSQTVEPYTDEEIAAFNSKL
jgi:hypothetical protein